LFLSFHVFKKNKKKSKNPKKKLIFWFNIIKVGILFFGMGP